jgi:hypothetical protein
MVSCLVGFVVTLIGVIYICAWLVVIIPWAWWGSMWGLANIVFGTGLLAMVLIHYIKTNVTDPGRVPPGWKPPNATAEELQEAITKEKEYRSRSIRERRRRMRPVYPPGVARYCLKCEEFKPPRTHHCSDCARCTLKMDHHCPWVGNCVGYQNHKYFINFLWFAVAGMGYAALLFIVRLVGLISHVSMVIRERKIKGEPENLSTLPGEGEGGILDIPMVSVTICVINLIIIIPLVLSILCLLVYQLNLICENLTSIEEFEKKALKKQAKQQGKDFKKFKWYYDLGRMENLRQVLGQRVYQWFLPKDFNPPGSGLSFLVNNKETA